MIGILIVAHDTLGDSLVEAVTHVLGATPPQFDVFPSTATDDPLLLLPKARAAVAALDTGDGVLIFSDIYGATPCNLAGKLLPPGRVEVDRRREPADAGARVHVPHEGHGHDGQEGDLRRLRRRAAHRARPGLCSSARLRSSTSWACTRARRPS